jgi:hypothetical protein
VLAHDRHTGRPLVADSFGAAVYGSIVVAALLAALRETHVPAGEATVSVISTTFVFWLAHVWSQITGERIHHGRRFDWRHAGEIARTEWPLIEAAFVPAVVLLLGSAGVLSDHGSLSAALVVCGLQLVGWGFVVGWRAYGTWRGALLSAIGDGLLGFALVALETAVLH